MRRIAVLLSLAAALTFGCTDAAPPSIAGGTDNGSKQDVRGEGIVPIETTPATDPGPDEPTGKPDVEILPGGPGWTCNNNEECDADYCVETAQGKQCSEICIEECTLEGWGCKSVTPLGGGDQISICLPVHPNLCDPCAAHSDCNLNPEDSSAYCIPRDDGLGSFCGADCSDVPCPSGYSCADVSLGAIGTRRQCVPVSGACTCSSRAITMGLSTPCQAQSELGTCTGARVCSSDGLTDCDARTASEETCGPIDDDCDGQTDEIGAIGCVDYFRDLDQDGYGDSSKSSCLCAPDETFKVVEKGDCDDMVLLVNPNAKEQCDGIDNDCDGDTDEDGAIGCTARFTDLDGDTWGDPASETCLCEDDGSHPAVKGGDCDDTTETVKPAASESCDGKDNDCDSITDPVGSAGCTAWYRDGDQDDYGVLGDSKCLCAAVAPYDASATGDCDDNNLGVKPSALESCGGLDDNCDGSTDPAGSVGCTTYFRDGDGDKAGLSDDSQCLCTATGAHTALVGGDCNDQDTTTSPLVQETCNGKDDDCDGSTDEAGASGCSDYYRDEDEDEYGVTADKKCLCAPDGDYRAEKPGDCDDQKEARNPDAAEACGNAVDDDCDNQVDEEGAIGCVPYYRDQDTDAYGTAAESRCLCAPSGAFSTSVAGDCLDTEPEVHPNAPEKCNDADDDCDLAVDEENAGGCLTYYEDGDKDGYGVTNSTKCLCDADVLYRALAGGDCKDTNDDIRPGQQELCNNVDDDCNLVVDDEDAVGCATRYIDADNDGFGVPGTGKCICPGDDGTASKAGDCNDNDLLVYPGQPCGSPTCSGYTLTPASVCEGTGACSMPGGAPCPAGTLCANGTTCKTSCIGDADCIPGNFCVAGVCTGKRLDGSQCLDDAQCQSGHCDSGFCCAGGKCCGGVAGQCDDGNVCTNDSCGADFQCKHSSNTAECAGAFCDGNTYTGPRTCKDGVCSQGGAEKECVATDPCMVGSCSLTSGTGCKDKPGAPGVPCGNATCSGSTLTSGKLCDGSGLCTLGGSTSTCAGGYVCDGAGAGCRNACSIDGHCRNGFYCDGGLCLPRRADGSSCGGNNECVSTHCDHGVCCGSGWCCRNSGDCEDQNGCTSDSCSGNFQCQNTPNTNQCASGQCTAGGDYIEPKYCVDGSCSVGGKTVSCDTNNPCRIETCNPGSGGCGQKATPIGTSCAKAVCTGSTRISAKVCDGLGGCALGGTPQNCPGGYLCAADGESCKSGCSADSDCQLAFYCGGGLCLPKKTDGSGCGGATECISGNCNNATCCTTGKTCCQGDGDCDDGNACTTDTCNGEFWCTTSYAPSSTECAVGSCSGLTRTRAKTCDGLGNCTQGGGTENCDQGNSCRSYGCTASQCTASVAPNGILCASSTCAGSTFTPAKTCQAGTCKADSSVLCVGGYVCLANGSCANSCTADTGCQTGYFCSAAGTCQPKRDNGEACAKDNQCTSSHCSNGLCCNTGNCCAKNSDCGDGNICTNDVCNTTLFQCTNPNNNAECLQGFCFGLEHYAARSCSAGACALGGTYTNCTPENPSACVTYGCDPTTGCTQAPSATGVVCGTPTCSGNMLTASKTCNGSGTCVAPSPSPCAGGFACDATGAACRTSCSGNTQCASTHYCVSPNCVPKKAAGADCAAATECASNYCNNGHCCATGTCCGTDVDCNDNEVCTKDTCDASFKCTTQKLTSQCAAPGCSGLLFTDTRFCDLTSGKCTAGGTTQNCAGNNECFVYGCDASISGNPCTAVPRTGAPCGTGPSCSGYTLTNQSTCNVNGQCINGAALDCANNLLCADATSCRTSCSTDTHCRAGHFCDVGTGKCTSKLANGGVCLASNQCQSAYCNSGYCCTNSGSNPTCCPNSAFCDDSNFCTDNVCNADSQCTVSNKPNTTECAAAKCLGNVPYPRSVCTNGVCPSQTPGSACDPTNPGIPICKTLGCDSASGSCVEQPLANGTPCSTSSCNGGNVTSSNTCNGSGTCVVSGSTTVPCPGGFACLSTTACRVACTTDNQCQSGYICEGNKCRSKKSSGESCTNATQCLSGNCNKGLCCAAGGECCATEADCSGNSGVTASARCVGCVNSACTHKASSTMCRAAYCSGTSRVPDQFCSNGVCPTGSAQSCAGANPCVAYGCSSGACTSPNAPTGTPCSAKKCVGQNELVLASNCNGLGTCVEPSATPCANNLRCNDAGTDCRPGCLIDSHCLGGYFCEGTQCKLKKARGESCTAAGQCSSGYCNSGYCCDSGTCCKTDSNCTPPNNCSSATCTNNQCTYQVQQNKVCAGAACSGSQIHTPESRCDAAGTCVQQGAQKDCGAASTSCSLGQCSLTAAGGCVTVPQTSGTSCGTAACVDYQLVPAKVCNGSGTCVANGTQTPCPGNLRCLNSTTCRTNCGVDSDCRTGFFCDTGTCSPVRPNGAPCTKDSACTSSHCESSICCTAGECCLSVSDCSTVSCKDAACTNNGCTYSNNSAVCAAGSCGGTGNLTFTSAKLCTAGSCPASSSSSNCSGANVCKQYWCDPVDGCLSANKPATTDCGTASCTANKYTSAARCDGAGVCVSSAATDCPNGYACNATATACRTSCSSDTHCASGRICMGGACVPPLADGSSCTAGLQCQSGYCGSGICCAPGGTCCTTASQCGDGNICTDDACAGFVCTHQNNTKPCESARCEGAEFVAAKQCSAGTCSGGGARTLCDLGLSCMDYECSQTQGCLATPSSQGLPCGSSSCSGTVYTPPNVCDGFGNCSTSSPQQCDDADVCTGTESCSTTTGCVAGNPNGVWICGDGTCQSTCESATSCIGDCTLAPAYTLALGEYDAWTTGGVGATNRISKYGCNALSYPGAEYAYRLTAPIAGTVTVTLGGADAQTDLIVLANNSGDPSQCVTVASGSGAAKSFTVTAGTTYVLVVDRRTAGSTPYTIYARYTGQCKVRLAETWDRNAFPRAWTSEANWQTAQDSPFGATHVKFTGSPVLTSFTKALTSPVYDISGCTTLNVKLKWRFTEDTTNPAALPHTGVTFRVESSTNGGTVWSTLLTYPTSSGPTPPPYKTESITVNVPAGAAQGRLKFTVLGDTSQYISRFQIEDIEVTGP